jgi:hypothetical protein
MAEITFSLADIFERTFGYKTSAFEPEFSEVQGNRSPGRKEQGALGSPYYSTDAFGKEYYMPVTIKYPDSGKASQQNGSDGVGSGVLKKWDLPYPVISLSSRKNIVETTLTERRGTVKELINIEDYEITIRGFIIAKENEFPESEVTTLRNIYEQNVALSIQSPLTDIFLLRPDRSGNDQVVIKELKFHEVSGVKNVRPYELRMVSDEPFNLVSIS